MKRIEDIERCLRQLESHGEPGLHQRILDSLVSEMEKSKEQTASPGRPLHSSLLNSSLIRVGAPAGAVVILIAIAVISLRPPDAQAVMTQVATKVETIPAVVYNLHTSTVINDAPATEASAIVYHSVLRGSRHDVLEDGRVVGETYILPAKKQIILINHSKKEYVRRPLSEADAEQFAGLLDVRNWLDAMVAEGKRAGAVEYLGKKKINGVEVMGFALDEHGLFGRSVPSAEGFMRLWVDPKEHLPVLMEIEYSQKIQYRNLEKEERLVSMRAHDFEWDVQLGPDTFGPDIPEDYSLVSPGNSQGIQRDGEKVLRVDSDNTDGDGSQGHE